MSPRVRNVRRLFIYSLVVGVVVVSSLSYLLGESGDNRTLEGPIPGVIVSLTSSSGG